MKNAYKWWTEGASKPKLVLKLDATSVTEDGKLRNLVDNTILKGLKRPVGSSDELPETTDLSYAVQSEGLNGFVIENESTDFYIQPWAELPYSDDKKGYGYTVIVYVDTPEGTTFSRDEGAILASISDRSPELPTPIPPGDLRRDNLYQSYKFTSASISYLCDRDGSPKLKYFGFPVGLPEDAYGLMLVGRETFAAFRGSDYTGVNNGEQVHTFLRSAYGGLIEPDKELIQARYDGFDTEGYHMVNGAYIKHPKHVVLFRPYYKPIGSAKVSSPVYRLVEVYNGALNNADFQYRLEDIYVTMQGY